MLILARGYSCSINFSRDYAICQGFGLEFRTGAHSLTSIGMQLKFDRTFRFVQSADCAVSVDEKSKTYS